MKTTQAAGTLSEWCALLHLPCVVFGWTKIHFDRDKRRVHSATETCYDAELSLGIPTNDNYSRLSGRYKYIFFFNFRPFHRALQKFSDNIYIYIYGVGHAADRIMHSTAVFVFTDRINKYIYMYLRVCTRARER